MDGVYQYRTGPLKRAPMIDPSLRSTGLPVRCGCVTVFLGTFWASSGYTLLHIFVSDNGKVTGRVTIH